MASYAEKLKDPRWQRKRLKVFQAADFKCEHCYAQTSTLNAHHTVYLKGREPWEYDEPGMVICLCDGCHEQWHAFKRSLDQYFAYLNVENLERARDAIYLILREQMAEERSAREAQ